MTCCASGDRFAAFDIVLTQRGRGRWKWSVRGSNGCALMCGSERSRSEARYKAERALFLLLCASASRVAKLPLEEDVQRVPRWARTHEHQIFKRIAQLLPGANDAEPRSSLCARIGKNLPRTRGSAVVTGPTNGHDNISFTSFFTRRQRHPSDRGLEASARDVGCPSREPRRKN